MSQKKSLTYNAEQAEKEANEIAFRFSEYSNPLMAMERTYGADFSNIKIHSDDNADRKVKSLGKDALASGRDIFFGRGILDMESQPSRALLAHELVHTMQQGTAGGEQAISAHMPEGTEQGGILDWFKKKYRNYKANKANKARIKAMPKANNGFGQAREEAMKGFVPRVGQLGSAEAKEEFKTIFDEEHVANANAKYGQAGTVGERASKAVQTFGLRASGGSESSKDNVFKGSVFQDLNDNFIHYFQSLEKGGTDFAQISDTMSTEMRPNTKTYMHNEQTSKIAQDMLSMFGTYAESPEGLEYIDTFHSGIKDMDMYASKENNPLEFIMSTLINKTVGPSYAKMSQKDNEIYKNKDLKMQDGRKNIVRETTKILAFITDMDDAEKQKLPPDIKLLVDQYEALRNRIGEKIAARV